MSKTNDEDGLRGLKSDVHSAIIGAIVEEGSLDKSDIFVYPRQQQRIYLKYTDKIMKLITSRDQAIRENTLQDLLSNEMGEDRCVCEQSDSRVCDHNWSLCNEIRNRLATVHSTNPKLEKEQ